MAQGREYTNHQRKIINRYYEHRDAIMSQKLGEIVSEIYLAETEKKKNQLWKRAENALKKLSANDARVRNILETQDEKALAQLANDLG
ncbi:MAG: hypothetical protein AAGB34_02570 [Planctomycetota bacterium]